MNITGYEEEDLTDFPSIINKMIENKINQTINTCFIAEVTEVANEKISVINTNKYIYGSQTKDYPIISNVLVGTLHIGGFKVQIPIKKGDLGICIVSQGDITNFKNTQQRSVPNTPRKYDISDSIFLPLQFFNSKSQDVFILENEDTTITISGSDIQIQSKNISITSKEPLEIGNTQGTLLDVIKRLITLIDNLSIAKDSRMSPIIPTEYNIDKPLALAEIERILK